MLYISYENQFADTSFIHSICKRMCFFSKKIKTKSTTSLFNNKFQWLLSSIYFFLSLSFDYKQLITHNTNNTLQFTAIKIFLSFSGHFWIKFEWNYLKIFIGLKRFRIQTQLSFNLLSRRIAGPFEQHFSFTIVIYISFSGLSIDQFTSKILCSAF